MMTFLEKARAGRASALETRAERLGNAPIAPDARTRFQAPRRNDADSDTVTFVSFRARLAAAPLPLH
ncbi:MAG: hypothetical protein WCD16_09965 [Paracoccaceae bacterium]